ncbi:3-ketodihydrosphingosine reductase-like isoform X2 [Saccostrea echinata]|uniref:3-ketodihydrosphingosine reductase-like isoform X2 n=1 Tax=Saccostrea echinata TaxID=191078 RepID=UPI002A801FC0|nr:3-ketodihydrosphingosine reductase-like isoform X2 [Saccostrea echinata]
MYLYCFIFFLLFIIFIISKIISPKRINIQGKHVLITGGSSGIGKALAIEAVRHGANVTIIARNEKRLEEAKQEIESHIKDKSSQVFAVSVDITKDADKVKKAVSKAEKDLGPITILINNAGSAIAGRFEETSIEQFQRMIDLNFLGSVNVTKAAIKGMKENNEGRIVFISSQAGQVGVFGYTAYSASKFALRGFAESLQMEVKPYNIYITMAFPPDTDTPGLAEENKSKPKETLLISDTVGLFSPSYVAKSVFRDALNGRFLSYVGMDGWLLSNLSSGMSPATSVVDLLQQVFAMGIFRFVCQFYLFHFDRIIRKCKEEKDSKLKSS